MVVVENRNEIRSLSIRAASASFNRSSLTNATNIFGSNAIYKRTVRTKKQKLAVVLFIKISLNTDFFAVEIFNNKCFHGEFVLAQTRKLNKGLARNFEELEGT
jgi:hypothetical protein